MTVTAQCPFAHDGREVQPGDRLVLTPDVAAFYAARGWVRAGAVLTTRVAA